MVVEGVFRFQKMNLVRLKRIGVYDFEYENSFLEDGLTVVFFVEAGLHIANIMSLWRFPIAIAILSRKEKSFIVYYSPCKRDGNVPRCTFIEGGRAKKTR